MDKVNNVCVRLPVLPLTVWRLDNNFFLLKYRGTGVGLINRIQPAAEILESMRAETVKILDGMAGGGE